MQDLEKALRIALVAHSGQIGKDGMPYIFHPIRVSQQVISNEAKIVALLHDVVEDTSVTLEQISAEFDNPVIIDAIDKLTHRKEESYDLYIEAIKNNPIACEVKLADLLDNMNLGRLKEFTEKDAERMVRYSKAFHALSGI